MAKRLPGGTVTGAPFGTDMQVGTARRMITDLSFRSMPWVLLDDFEDFMTPASGGTLSAPLINNTANADINNIPVANTSTSVAFFRITRAGVVTAASVIPGTTLATDNTNFVTFTMANLGTAAGSNITMLATGSGVNTTKTTGGAALTVNVPYVLTLSATASTLPVNVGDVVKLTATVSGTLANIVDAPQATLTVSSPGSGLITPFTFQTAGNPSVALLANTAGGVAELKLGATSEAQTAGLSWGDSLLLNNSSAGATNANGVSVPAFQCFLQIPTALTTNQKLLVGLGTAMSATASSITKAAAFQLDASMNVLLTTRDGTNTNNSQTPSTGTFTLVAGSWYLLSINWPNPNAVEFWVSTASAGDILLGTQTMAALASSDVFQPFLHLGKASGTTTPSVQVDFIRTIFFRGNMT